MDIAILQHSFNSTTMGWIRGLEARGHRVVTVVADDSEPFGGWPEDVTVVVVPDKDGWRERLLARLLPSRKPAVYALPRVRDLRRTLQGAGTDAVLVKVYSLRNVLALLVALSLGIRRVAWIEQVPPPNREWRVLRRLGVLPRRVFTALDARPGGVAEPLDPPAAGWPVITYAPEIPAATHRQPLTGRPVRILTVAAFWDADHKRPFWTLEAARDAGLLDGRCTLTFTGLGKTPGSQGSPRKFVSQRILKNLVEELDVAHLVEVRVNVPFLAMPAVYAEHDLLVLPSAWEQFGMVVPEAMAHGLAVVASDCVGSRGCIVPGVTGELFATHDRDDLARILGELVAEPSRTEAMGRAGRAFIEEHASPDRTARLLEALLTD
jgi:glycosyltransferase involved in cell wall biosynthesis